MQIGERREPAMVLIFSLLTCGIYYFWWIYTVSGEVARAMPEKAINPANELIFSIITCSLYTWYWDYKMGQYIAEMQGRVGLPVKDNSVLYLVLDILQVGIVNSLIEQGALNDVWAAAQGAAPAFAGDAK
jgi:hypothetical protein